MASVWCQVGAEEREHDPARCQQSEMLRGERGGAETGSCYPRHSIRHKTHERERLGYNMSGEVIVRIAR